MSEINPYIPPESITGQEIKKPRTPTIVKIILILFVVAINILLNMIFIGKSNIILGIYSLAFLLGKVIFIPLLFVGIFQVFKKFRNLQSRLRIFFWSSVIIMVLSFSNIFV